MDKIKEWINSSLIVARFPVSKEFQEGGIYSDIDVVINVSDEYYPKISDTIIKEGKMPFFFPMGESGSDMGISSIYGALMALYDAYAMEKRVLLHCQAGANRSPTVKAAFYYLMTNEHLEEISKGSIILTANRLKDNCGKHLPELKKMELWLSKCKEAWDNHHKFLGGMYDWTIRKSGLSNT